MPPRLGVSSVYGMQWGSAGSLEVGRPLAPDTRGMAQQRADIEEDLELRQWRALYPMRRQLASVVDEAARRAASAARLEDALRRLH